MQYWMWEHYAFSHHCREPVHALQGVKFTVQEAAPTMHTCASLHIFLTHSLIGFTFLDDHRRSLWIYSTRQIIALLCRCSCFFFFLFISKYHKKTNTAWEDSWNKFLSHPPFSNHRISGQHAEGSGRNWKSKVDWQRNFVKVSCLNMLNDEGFNKLSAFYLLLCQLLHWTRS